MIFLAPSIPGRDLTLVTTIGESTAVNRLSFRLTYEFVVLAQAGEPVQPTGQAGQATPAGMVAVGQAARVEKVAQPAVPTGEPSCDRVFRSQRAGGLYKSGGDGSTNLYPFGSPANVFLFGRGGRANLTCTYLFLGGAGQRIRLAIQNISLGGDGGFCRTVHDPELGRYRCDPYSRSSRPDNNREETSDIINRGVYISEVAGERLTHAQCFCQYLPGAAVQSTGNAIQVTFAVPGMDETEDAESIFFRGSFQFLDEGDKILCDSRGAVIADNRLGGGRVTLDLGRSCSGGEVAWARKVAAASSTAADKQLLLRVPGLQLPEPYTGSPPCPLKSRLVVTTTTGHSSVICPVPANNDGSELLQIIAAVAGSSLLNNEAAQSLQTVLVRLIGPSSAPPARLSWLEYTPENATTLPHTALSADPWSAVVASPLHPIPCTTLCPGLGCISPALWCDGIPDCPDGADESTAACSSSAARLFSLQYALLWLAFGGGAAALVILIAILGVRLRMRRKKGVERRLKQNGGNHSSDDSILKRTSNGTVETMLNHKVR
jgi:hypothetical protein